MRSDRDNGGWSRDTTATLEPVLALVKLALDGFPIVKFLSRLNLAVLLLVLHVSPALSQQAGSLDDLLPEQKHPPTRPFLCKAMIGTKAEGWRIGKLYKLHVFERLGTQRTSLAVVSTKTFTH